MTNQKKKRGPPPKGSRSTPQRTGPAFVTPMAAQVVKGLPEGDDWIYELKFDGYRALIIKDEQRVELRSRKNKDLTGMYPGDRGGRPALEGRPGRGRRRDRRAGRSGEPIVPGAPASGFTPRPSDRVLRLRSAARGRQGSHRRTAPSWRAYPATAKGDWRNALHRFSCDPKRLICPRSVSRSGGRS